MSTQGHDRWTRYSQGWGRDHPRSLDVVIPRAAELKASLLQHHPSGEDFGAENPFIFIFPAGRWGSGFSARTQPAAQELVTKAAAMFQPTCFAPGWQEFKKKNKK